MDPSLAIVGFLVASVVLAGAWGAWRTRRARQAWDEAVARTGWTAGPLDASVLAGTPLADPRAELGPIALGDGSFAVGVHIPRSRVSTWRAVLGRPRTASGPLGAVESRQGTSKQRMMLQLARAAGVPPRDLPGWSWAWISPGTGPWVDDRASPVLEGLMRPGEVLWLTPTHILLTADGSALPGFVGDDRIVRIAEAIEPR